MSDLSAPDFTVEQVIGKYLDLREEIESLEAKHKSALAPLKKQMDGIETYLKALSNQTGQLSFGTARGTAFMSTVTACKVKDWDAVQKFIRENNAWQLLNKAVNKTAVGEFIEQHPDKIPPPGVDWVVMREIKVRKSTSASDIVETE